MAVSAGIIVSIESPIVTEDIKQALSRIPGCKLIFITVKSDRLFVVTEKEYRGGMQ